MSDFVAVNFRGERKNRNKGVFEYVDENELSEEEIEKMASRLKKRIDALLENRFSENAEK